MTNKIKKLEEEVIDLKRIVDDDQKKIRSSNDKEEIQKLWVIIDLNLNNKTQNIFIYFNSPLLNSTRKK